jgi:hypothetical protein
MQSARSISIPRWIAVSLSILIAAAAVAAIGLDVMRRAKSMQLADSSAAAIFASPPGSHIKAVLHVGQKADVGRYTSEILENVQGADYRGTGRSVVLDLEGDTRFIMGAAADIRTGAIVQADGVLEAAHALHAARIVVLNDYVHVIR